MKRYNENGQMIDTDHVNKSAIAQEIIIEIINELLNDEACAFTRKEAFTLGLYASQFQMKYMIEEAIIANGDYTEYEIELLHLLQRTEEALIGRVISHKEIQEEIEKWFDKHYPLKLEK